MTAPGASADLYRPAGTVARRDAATLIAKVDKTCETLAGIEHPEALHDFRVALRRLRTYLGAYRAALPFGAGDRRRLRTLAHATNAARDIEVMLGWVEEYRTAHPRSAGPLEKLTAGLTAERDARYRHILEKLPRRWTRLSTRLWHHLKPAAQIDVGDPNFLEASAAVYRADLKRLHASHTRLDASWSLPAAHQLRIAIKRMRYLLEAIGHRLTGIAMPLAELRRAQDLLGELHDLHVLGEELPALLTRDASERAAGELARLRDGGTPPRADAVQRRDPLPAQLRLYHHLTNQFQSRQEWIRDTYLTHDLAHLIDGLEAVAHALSASP